MSTYETTLAEFQAFQKETGWQVQGCRNWEARDGVFNMWYRDDLNPTNSGMNQTPQDPVVCVRREDGRAFAEWLSKKQGKPTVYLQRSNGNMLLVQELRLHFTGVMI